MAIIYAIFAGSVIIEGDGKLLAFPDTLN